MKKTTKEIVEENFKGLDELIDDRDLLLFYKDLIETCMEEYALFSARYQGCIDIEKLGKKFDNFLDSVTKEDFENWMKINSIQNTMKKKLVEENKPDSEVNEEFKNTSELYTKFKTKTMKKTLIELRKQFISVIVYNP